MVLQDYGSCTANDDNNLWHFRKTYKLPRQAGSSIIIQGFTIRDERLVVFSQHLPICN